MECHENRRVEKKYYAQLFKYSKISITVKRLAFILALASDG